MTGNFGTSDVELILCRWVLRGKDLDSLNTHLQFSRDFNELKFNNFAIEGIEDALSLTTHLGKQKENNLRFRLALHLAPKEAIDWDNRRPETRRSVIKKFIMSSFAISENLADPLSRDVAIVLKTWQEQRKTLLDKVSLLLDRQGNQCASCKLSFTPSRKEKEDFIGIEGTDEFKPYFGDTNSTPAIWMEPQVDHIDPISQFGTNKIENLQVLCRLCNQGKSDGRTIPIEKEYKYATRSLKNVPHGHRVRMFFMRIQMDEFRCQLCKSENNELTVRLLRGKGGYLISNLKTICYPCDLARSAVDTPSLRVG